MATKDKLMGSFGSLSDTLAFRFDPSFPGDVSERWLAVMAHSATVGHRPGAFTLLPPESSAFHAVITALDDATHDLVIATAPPARLAALDRADAALARLETLLDNA